jgi:hypothetical protein
MPHAAQDDPACAAPPLEQHDESQHAIGAAAAAGHEHCAVCHWSRTFRSPLDARWVSDLALAAGSLLRPGRADGRRSADPGRLPARAPPSRLA